MDSSINKLKVVHFTSVHPLCDSRIFSKQCVSLSKEGHNVTLIGCGVVKNDDSQVTVMTVSGKKGVLTRLFFINFYITYKALKENADIYQFHDPELIPYAIILRMLGKKVVFDAHEDLSLQINNKQWVPSYLKSSLSLFAKLLYKLADKFMSGIVTVTPTLIAQFNNKNTSLVRNFPILDEFSSIDITDINNRANNLVYVGGITKIRGIVENIEAVNMVPIKYKAKLLVGGIFQTLNFENEVNNLNLDNVLLKGWLNRIEVKVLLSESKIGLVTLHPVPNYYDAYPVKMFEYMAAGLPVIASDFPVYREIIEKADCGLVVDPLDVEVTKKKIITLLDSPEILTKFSQNGREAALKYYNWNNEFQSLLNLYQKVLGKPLI